VVAEAEARDIVIGGVIHIGKARSKSTSAAYGGHKDEAGTLTPGAAVAEYERSFENVAGPGISCGQDCDPTAVAAAITAVLGAQVRVELPGVHKLKTAGGAHAHSWREPWELQQDVLVNQQDDTHKEVPALRLMYVGDRDLPSRIIFEFAATKAEAKHIQTHYVPPDPVFDSGDNGIFDDLSDIDFTPALPAVPDGDPVTRTVVLGGREGTTVASELPAPPGQSFFERVLKKGGEFALRALGGMLMTAALFSLFSVPPFLASRRRHLARLAAGDR
jgi:hypothetical protein